MHYLPIYRSIHPIIHTIAKQRTEESANEPANEPTNEPANQPTTNQPSNQRTNKPTKQQTRSNQQTKNQRTNHRIHLQMQEFSPDLGLQLQLHWRPRHGEATWFFLRRWCWASQSGCEEMASWQWKQQRTKGRQFSMNNDSAWKFYHQKWSNMRDFSMI